MDLIQVPKEKSMELSVAQQITARTTVMRIDSGVQEKGGARPRAGQLFSLTPLDQGNDKFLEHSK